MLSIRPWPRSLASPLSSPFHPQRCELCLKPGATVGCCLSSCLSNFHFMCARASYCIFQDDKKVFCQKHTDLLDGKVGHYRGGRQLPTALFLPSTRGPLQLLRPGPCCLSVSPLAKPPTVQSLPTEPSLASLLPPTNAATLFTIPPHRRS